jgi:hypothetical protein
MFRELALRPDPLAEFGLDQYDRLLREVAWVAAALGA